ncbi:hypothetical protein TWF192_007030 [Orbilia oligospora]|uniref:Uncharacterized protein n=1 Tax=Orbilia oligospora TaxID=2813651 RepID=A0A6G1MKX4_ORBOL|nr:hypothetical protein TWF191_004823 [Orbilia oligospora]KAF3262356.1 hypothetical protein TWF192_007030 [Orbilia oligospora]
MSGFLKLPSELTDEIFGRISRIDLYNTSLTCRGLYEKSLSSINRFLKISVVTSTRIDEARAKKIFSKAFTDVSLEYLRELEVSGALKQKIGREIEPRHIHVAPSLEIGGNSSGLNGCTVEAILNLNLRDLLSRLPPQQLKKFTCSSYWGLKESSDDRFFEPQTLSALFSPGNMLTTLNLTFSHSLSLDCSVFYVPHLTSFTFHAEDFTIHYHSIFSILYSCQKVLKELNCNNLRYQSRRRGRIPPSRVHEALFYMDEGFAKWKGCTICGQDNPPSIPAKRRIRLTKLKVWRVDGVGHMMTDLFGPYNLVQDSPLVDVEVAIGALAFVNLAVSEGGSLQLQRLLQCANGTRGSPDSDGLGEYFRHTKGLVKVTLSFHQNLGFDWLEALEGSAGTLKYLHLASVFGDMMLTEDEIEGLGKSLQKLEMLTVSSSQDLPSCILNSESFPRLRYFGNRAYSFLNAGATDRFRDFIQMRFAKTGLLSPLRLIRFRLPGQNYLIEGDSVDGVEVDGNTNVRVRIIEDWIVPEVLRGFGDVPRFG